LFYNLSTNNPVRRLLEPQSSYLIPVDDVLLLQWSAGLDGSPAGANLRMGSWASP
jgi:hypothetical protein